MIPYSLQILIQIPFLQSRINNYIPQLLWLDNARVALFKEILVSHNLDL